MKIPKGFKEVESKDFSEMRALKLNKSIYGLVQAARQWHKKLKKRL